MSQKRFSKLTILLLIMTINSVLIAQKINIAVLSLTANNVPNVEAAVVSDRIRIALKSSGSYNVIEREIMENILGEQELQMSGCTESECMVELGKLLAVRYIVSGSLSKIGSYYTIEIKMVDVETGKIVQNVAKDFKGAYQMLLTQAVPDVVDQLTRIDESQKDIPKINIALLKFEGRGIDNTEASIISDRLRVELRQTNKFNMIEREMMAKILEEQSFQLGGCTESECMVEVGQLLSVEKMVGGSISKIGNLYVIEARIIDVESGKIDENVAEDFAGPIELLLMNTTKKIARRLAGLSVEEMESKTEMFLGYADLSISSTPSGGVIYFDDQPLNKTTPAIFKDMPAGVHTIKVEKGNLENKIETELKDGRLNKVELELKERVYTLIVYSDPSGANVKINGRLIGKTPVEYTFMKSDIPFDVYIKYHGFVSYKVRIDSTVQQITRIDAKLKKGGWLIIRSNPNNCELYIDNKFVGNTPFEEFILLGKHNIQLKKKNYRTLNKKVDLTIENKRININEKLKPILGTIDFSSIPQNSKVYINDDEIKLNSPIYDIQTGKHKILIKHEGYYKYKGLVNVSNQKNNTSETKALVNMINEIDKKQSYKFNMKPKSKSRSLLLSSAFSGAGQYYYGSPIKGTIYSAMFLGSVAMAYLQNEKYVDSWNQYETAVINYNKAEMPSDITHYKNIMNQKYDDSQQDKKMTLAFTGLAGAVWAVNLFDVVFTFPKPVQTMAEKTNLSINSNKLKISYNF